MHATYVSSDFARCKIGKNFQDAIMTEQVPCFQLGFDFLNVENSDDCEELSAEVACSLTNFGLH